MLQDIENLNCHPVDYCRPTVIIIVADNNYLFIDIVIVNVLPFNIFAFLVVVFSSI